MPAMLTCEASVTAMVRVSVPLLMVRLPVPAMTFSLNVRTMLEPTATAVALSAGLDDTSVGAWVSTV